MPSPAVRHPAVAGRFYPAQAQALTRDLDQFLGRDEPKSAAVENALGCVVPHAGYMYSGHVAGAVYRRLPARPSYIILAPNHFGRSAPLALMPMGAWLTPLGSRPTVSPLVRVLTLSLHLVTEYAHAPQEEDSME